MAEKMFIKISTYQFHCNLVICPHKFNQMKNPHEFYFSELQLYMPFKSENELEPDCYEKCRAKYDEVSEHNGLRKVHNVKKILMEHLEDVTEGTERARELVESSVGDMLDAENAQENLDCELTGVEEDPRFEVLNPENLNHPNESTSDSIYRKIELVDSLQLIQLTRNLDGDQRLVLDRVVAYAKDIEKSCKNIKNNLNPPLLVVQGGAG